MLPHPLTNFEIQRYHNEPAVKQVQWKFTSFYSRNSLPKTQDGAYVINLDECQSVWTYRIVLYLDGNNVTFLDSFGVEHIPKEMKKFVGHKIVKANIYRIQVSASVICRYFHVDTFVWDLCYI